MLSQLSLIAAALVVLAAARAVAVPVTTQLNNGAQFLTFTPNVFSIKDNEPAEVGVQLKKNPEAIVPHVFFQADGVLFNTCSFNYTKDNWDKPQKLKLYPKASFTAGKTTSVLGALLAWETHPDDTKSQTVSFDRTVTAGRICQSNGDPHYGSFDGKHFDFMGMSCYMLFKSPSLVVQARHGPYIANKNAAVNVAVAIAYGKAMYVVDILSPAKKVTELTPADVAKNIPAGSVTITQNPTFTDVQFSMGDGAQVKLSITAPGTPGAWMNIHVVIPAVYKGKTAGLCGPYDDNVNNDWTKKDKTVAADATSFGNSWQLAPEEDIFTKGYKANFGAALTEEPPTKKCVFPKDVTGFGEAPEPEGYTLVETKVVDEYALTDLPVVTETKGRTDAAFVARAKEVCTKALTIPGLDKITEIKIPTNAQAITDCVEDCKLTGSWETVDGFRVAYQRNVHTLASAAMDKFKICAATGLPRTRKENELNDMAAKLGLSSFSCPKPEGEYADKTCGNEGICLTFGCQCGKGWSMYNCGMDLTKEPIPPKA